ncbi:MAG: hypothetical protein IPJ58_02435 [Ardenticatenia bacterium]|nr:hypothetical protein [Ardenticatenia bacterium]
MPLIIVMGMWVARVQVADSMGLLRELPSDAQALQINVTGQQWAWSFEYPKQAGVPESFSSDRLVLPVDRTAVFSISSPDVMHSFWIPEMRMKMDAIPGRVNKMRLTPNKAGEYKVRCAELCGTDHAYMESPVQVLAAEGFKVRRRQRHLKLSPEERGEKWAKTYGCVGCHSIDGKKMAGPHGRTCTVTTWSSTAEPRSRQMRPISRPASWIPTARSCSGSSPTSCPRPSRTALPRTTRARASTRWMT